MIYFDCPHCGNHFTVRDEHGGRDGWCRICKGLVIVPHADGTVVNYHDLPMHEKIRRLEAKLKYAATQADHYKFLLSKGCGELQELVRGKKTALRRVNEKVFDQHLNETRDRFQALQKQLSELRISAQRDASKPVDTTQAAESAKAAAESAKALERARKLDAELRAANKEMQGLRLALARRDEAMGIDAAKREETAAAMADIERRLRESEAQAAERAQVHHHALAQAREDQRRAEARLSQAEKRAAELEHSEAKAVSEAEALSQAIALTEARSAADVQTLREYAAQIGELRRKTEALETELGAAREELAGAQAGMTALRAENMEQARRLAASLERADTLTNAMTGADGAPKPPAAPGESAKLELATQQVAALESERAHLRRELDSLREQLSAAVRVEDGLRRDHETLVEQAKAASARAEMEAHAKVSALSAGDAVRAEMETLRAALDAREGEARRLQASLDESRDISLQLQRVTLERDRAGAEAESLRLELARLRTGERRNNVAELDALRGELRQEREARLAFEEKSNSELAALEEDLRAAEERSRLAEERVAELDQALARAETETPAAETEALVPSGATVLFPDFTPLNTSRTKPVADDEVEGELVDEPEFEDPMVTSYLRFLDSR